MTANLNKLRNLLELAERGEPKERIVARTLLEKLLAKHGLTLSDLTEERLARYDFKYGNWMEKSLLFQVVVKVTAGKQTTYWRRRGQGNTLSFDLTAAQAMDVELLYRAYVRAWAQELKDLLSGFIAANDIYGPATQDAATLSAAELERLRRVMRYAEGFDRVPIHKELTDGS